MAADMAGPGYHINRSNLLVLEFRMLNLPRSTALHVALGAAVGAFGLAAAPIIHSLLTGTGSLRLLRIALVIWPLITGFPAFLVALVLTVLLARLPLYRAGHAGR